MSRVAVLGGGAGGAAAAVELTRRGHAVRLWTRSPATLAPFVEQGGVAYEGVYGSGLTAVELLSNDLGDTLRGADIALVCLPMTALEDLAERWAEADAELVPVILNPGGTGGALLLARALAGAGAAVPPIAELSILTYTSRVYRPELVTISGEAQAVRLAALPGGGAALDAARGLYPYATTMPDVLGTSLANLNLVGHSPMCVLAMAWIEATGGSFPFYADAMTDGVATTIGALDAERRAVAAAFGHELPGVIAELSQIGFLPPETIGRPLRESFRLMGVEPAPTAAITAPDGLTHRYYAEDIGFALPALRHLASLVDVATPTADALFHLAATAAPATFAAPLTPERLGIAGDDRAALLARLRAPV